jgi:hypothetical protein
VVQSVLNGGPYYSDYHYDVTLSASPLSPLFFEVDTEQGMVIHNPTDQTYPYELVLTMSGLTPPDSLLTAQHRVLYKQVVFMPVNEQGGATGRAVQYDRASLMSALHASTEQLFPLKYQIPPREAVMLTVKIQTWEPKERGYIALRTVKKALGMSMSVTFPPGEGDQFDTDTQFGHPLRADPRVCVPARIDPNNGDRRIMEIRGGLLPFNGITFAWDRRPPLTSPIKPTVDHRRHSK